MGLDGIQFKNGRSKAGQECSTAIWSVAVMRDDDLCRRGNVSGEGGIWKNGLKSLLFAKGLIAAT